MNKILSLVCLVLLISVSLSIPHSQRKPWAHFANDFTEESRKFNSGATNFNTFKKQFGRSFSNSEEELIRRRIFESNLAVISKHNAAYSAGAESYWLQMNNFGDMTEMEYQTLLGFRANPKSDPSTAGCTHTSSIPNTTVDWRTAKAVTEVKNQGQCGSCWAFSASGAIEGAWVVSGHPMISVSEEEIVQCDSGDYGCAGGNMGKAFEYVITNGGVAGEATYPYTSGNGTAGGCKALFPAFQAPAARITSFCEVARGDEEDLERAVSQQPVAVAINAGGNAFRFYGGGILPARHCLADTLNHGVLAVGYGFVMDSAAPLPVKYWVVKNSWGVGWGDDGYIRMEKMAADVNHSACGIALDASYPIV